MKEKSQIEVFHEIWDERPHISELSGESLEWVQVDSDLWRCLFMHVLNKNNWPLYRTYKKNILLGLPREHALIDTGTKDQREQYRIEKFNEGIVVMWSVFYNLQYKLKKQYPKI